MKHFILTFILVLLFNITAIAQNELRFNKAIYIKLFGQNNSTTQIAKDTTITVPPGRVWKLERMSAGGITNAANVNGFADLNFNNTFIFLDNSIIFYANSGTNNTMNEAPVWLPEGTYRLTLRSSSTNSYSRGFVSAIEFILIP